MQGKKQLFVVALILAVGVVASLAGAQVPKWKVWEQADDTGRIVPHYSISLDGETFSEPRPTTYEITLRHGAFVPQADRGTPAVEPGLAADLDTNLFIVQFHTQPLEYYRQQLRAFGIDVYTYLAHHSHVVRMDPALTAVIEALPCVRWVGPYHPAYKIDPLVLDAPLGVFGQVNSSK